MKHKLILITSLILLASLLSGCAGTPPAADSGFLANSKNLKENRDRFPFNRAWVNTETTKKYQDFEKIYIPQVDTSYFEKMQWFQNYDEKSKTYLKEAADNLGIYMQQRFESELTNSTAKSFELIDNLEDVDADTAILNLAITELTPTPAGANRLAETAGFFIPFTGIAKSVLVKDGSIAIEASMVTGVERDVLLEFADREEDKSTPIIDASDFVYFRHAKQHIDTWAYQYVQLLSTNDSEQVKDSLIKVKL